MIVTRRISIRNKGVAACLASSAACGFVLASFVAVVRGIGFDTTAFLSTVKFPLFILIFVGVSALSACISLFTGHTEIAHASLGISAILFASLLALKTGTDAYFAFGLAVIIIIVARWLTITDRLRIGLIKLTYKSAYMIVVGLVILFTLFTAYFTMFKYRAFINATYDFGIFTQMFEQMRQTGLPMTTVERSGYLSHFAVHFSPFYYLLLPGYMLWPSPLYLIAVQALGVCLGAIPVYKIAAKLGFTPVYSVLLSAIYLFYPSMINGCFYDFHENKFLAVCVLYLIYFMIAEKPAGIFGAAILTLSIKEDAAIYVWCAALYLIFRLRGKKRWLGAALLGFAAAYFLLAIYVIKLCGGSIMLSRFTDYYSLGDKSILSVLRTCVFDIGYLISQVFVKEKLPFIIWTLVPVLFVPFASKKISLLLLLIPMVVINLMPSWIYQYNIDYQYTFGSCALVIAASIIAISEMDENHRRFFIITSLMICCVFSSSLSIDKAIRYSRSYFSDEETFKASEEILKTVPADAEVTACDYLIPHLYFVTELYNYPDFYSTPRKTEYYVVDTRVADTGKRDPTEFMGDDYYLVGEGGFVRIYRLNEALSEDGGI